MLLDYFEEDTILDRLVVVEFREPKQECRDEVVEDLVVVLFETAGGEPTVDGHLICFILLINYRRHLPKINKTQ